MGSFSLSIPSLLLGGGVRDVKGIHHSTSLKDAIASITSLVNSFPTPDDPINTVGLID